MAYLGNTGLTKLVELINTKFATKDELTANNKNTNRTVEYIVGTQTAATPSFTGASQDSSLYDGKCINYYLPFAGTSAGDTLNLTLADGTKTGAKPIYIVNTTRLTTHYAAGTVFTMTYSATKDAWYCGNYWSDSNTYDRNLLNDTRVTAGTNKIMGLSLIMEKADGTWESFTTTSGTGTTKARNTSGFQLGKIWVYNYNETIAANALTRTDYIYDCIPVTLTYSTNCGTTLVAYKPVYLVGTIGTDGLFYLDATWWTQTEPTTEDGKVYIYLGDATSTSVIYKVSYNPIYEYRDGAFQPYNPIRGLGTAAYQDTGHFALASHGNHVPATETANNAKFLRNDNTWQTVTPANIGALSTTGTAADSSKLGGTAAANYAKLASPTFTGTPKAPTATAGTNTTQIATTAFVQTAVANLVNSAPTTLDTLDELAAALGDDPNFATTIATQIGNKADANHTHNYAGSASAGGAATSANKLTTGSAIDGVTFDGSAAIVHYGTCSTAAATAAKTVACTSYTLVTGSRIVVKFTTTNTAANPTLNVNSTGAKAIQYRGAAITAGYLAANRTYEFVYDGTNYQLIGDIDTNTNTTYSAGTGISLSGTTFSNSGVRSIATGSTNGTISVNTNGTSTDVAVKGLGTAAYTESSAYATSGHTHNYAGSDSAGGPATSVAIEAGTANADRYVWFSWSGTGNEGKACYDAAFKYNPSTDNLTVTKINGVAVGTAPKFTDTNTLNTAGSTNSTSKLFLVGAASQAANPQTYSSSKVYETDGALVATSFAGSGASLTALNASNISSGTLAAARLATSGATAGSYGESADKAPGYAGTFNIPYVTVDTYGRVTAIANKKITLPSADNTDTKNTAGSTNSTSKLFLIGATSQAANPTTNSHSAVYETAGVLNATSYKVNEHGTIQYNAATGCIELLCA